MIQAIMNSDKHGTFYREFNTMEECQEYMGNIGVFALLLHEGEKINICLYEIFAKNDLEPSFSVFIPAANQIAAHNYFKQLYPKDTFVSCDKIG